MQIMDDTSSPFINPFFISSASSTDTEPEFENKNEKMYLLNHRINNKENNKKKCFFFLSFLFCIPIGIYTYWLKKKAGRLYKQNVKNHADQLIERAYHFAIYGLVIGITIDALILYTYFEVIT